MLSEVNVERFWDVCDDLGISVDEDTINKAWSAYCEKKGIPGSTNLPVSQERLFSIVRESLSLVGVNVCVEV